MPGVHFFDWRPHNRRAESLAEDLGATLWLAPDRLRRKSLAPLRYALLSARTIRILVAERPDVVIVSSPPSLCPIVAFLYSRISGSPYVIDAHHLATTGFWYAVPFGRRFNRFIMRRARVMLVHNRVIERLAQASGISAITLETKIPRLGGASSNGGGRETCKVLAPCSFDPDEPIEAVFEAARTLPKAAFYLTGDLKRLDPGLRSSAPRNVTLTGFLTQEEYDSLLASCDVVLATATNDYPVRPRAASEAIAAAKPLIASRNEATVDQLGAAAVLIENTAAEIVRALGEIHERYDQYGRAIGELKKARLRQYEAELGKLRELLPPSRPPPP